VTDALYLLSSDYLFNPSRMVGPAHCILLITRVSHWLVGAQIAMVSEIT
jgi:hypothetical protein